MWLLSTAWIAGIETKFNKLILIELWPVITNRPLMQAFTVLEGLYKKKPGKLKINDPISCIVCSGGILF